MSNIALKVENLSKQYRLGEIGTGTLSHDINRWWHKVRGKEDPYLKIGETNDRTQKGGSEYVWALKDINFEVKQGEILGIIGKNGAGKSTLLKVLSKVTGSTTGTIKAKGRIASLLEVGTGFHPEMTGRENIYMNGTIMGMSRFEIANKFDEIVEFAGVAKYLDTPVKRYSSGMLVRLGFAIAAHLEPEILIVDEVLAVGDAEFQKKAIGKMQDVSKGEGRTVLFVSHNMGSIQTLCNRGILLSEGAINYEGEIQDCIQKYLSTDNDLDGYIEFSEMILNEYGPKLFSNILSLELLNSGGIRTSKFFFGKKMTVKVSFGVLESNNRVEIGIAFQSSLGVKLGGFVSTWEGFEERFIKGEYTVSIEIPFLYFMPGKYSISIWIKEIGNFVDHQIVNCLAFTVYESDNNGNKTYLEKYRNMGLTLPSKWNFL